MPISAATPPPAALPQRAALAVRPLQCVAPVLDGSSTSRSADGYTRTSCVNTRRVLAKLATYDHLLPTISRQQQQQAALHSSVFSVNRYRFNNRVLRLGLTAATRGPPPHEQQQQQHLQGERGPEKKQLQGNMLSPSKPRATSQSAEFASRFGQRSSTRPKVIGLDSETMIPRSTYGSQTRGIGGFFPPMKLRMSGEHSAHSTRPTKSPALLLEVVAEQRCSGASSDHTSTRTTPAPAATSAWRPSNRAHRLTAATATSNSSRHASPGSADVEPKLYPRVPVSADLSELPRPHLLVSKDTPWVYRYKVKRNMNALSTIMASKSPLVHNDNLMQ